MPFLRTRLDLGLPVTCACGARGLCDTFLLHFFSLARVTFPSLFKARLG